MSLLELTAVELAKEIKAGKTTAVEAMKAVLEQIEKTEETYHCYITIDKEKAMQAAKEAQEKIEAGTLTGPLAGVPVAIKDNLCTKGVVTTCASKILENFVRDRFGVKVRSIELNVNQRCSAMLSSLTDVEEAAMAGSFGVRAALKGATGKMVSFERGNEEAYDLSCGLKDVSLICNREKRFPLEWITGGGCDVGDEFLKYALPLIQGEPVRKMKDGMPEFLWRT